MNEPTPQEQVEDFRARFGAAQAEIEKVMVGQRDIIEGVLIALIAEGHVLLEGVPGIGKTSLVRTLAQALSLTFRRIQFTPDLMPADITGTRLLVESQEGRRHFEFQPGPVFTNLLLADEINRATPRTQSALLEAMQERSVSEGTTTHALEPPFCVIATQNPIEMEGTYPLPEAQLDRFLFKLKVTYPSADQMHEILQRTTSADTPAAEKVSTGDAVLAMRRLSREVPIAEHVRDFAVRTVMGTHPDDAGAPEMVKRYVRYGASPRAAQAMVLSGKALALLAGRFHVSEDDLRAVACQALRHRIILNFEGEAEGIDVDDVIAAAVEAISEPAGSA